MSEALVARYWCHMCNQMVNPIMHGELKCPNCETGFIEEIEGREADSTPDLVPDTNSHWAPVLLGMMGGTARHRRYHQQHLHDDEDEEEEIDASRFVRRRRRHPAAVLQLLQGMRELALESNNPSEGDRPRERERDRQHVVLIDPLYQVMLQELLDTNRNSDGGGGGDGTSAGPLRDLVGSSFELFLQRLVENDPSRYGTPPTQKEVVEALPTVKVKESFSCPVCLDDLDTGAEAKEMPCKHQFHANCIVPWLELHSSCPVCRFQLPAESKTPNNTAPRTDISNGSTGGLDAADDEGGGIGRRSWLSMTWPFSGLFSSLGTQEGGSGSGTSASGPSAPSGSGNYHRANEN